MKLILSTPGLPASDRKNVERHIRHVMPHISKRLGRLDHDQLMFRVRLINSGQSKERDFYNITMSVQLPDHPIIAQKDGFDLHELVKDGEKAIKREIRKGVAKIRRDYLRRKRSSQRELFTDFSQQLSATESLSNSRENKPKSSEDRQVHPIFARLRPMLSHLHSYAQENIRSAIAANELPEDYLAPGDLVDEAIVALIEMDKNVMSDPVILERTLFQEIDLLLEKEIKERNQDGGNRVSIDMSAPKDEQWGVVGAEAEEMEYHRPYEALKMEDVLEDHESEIPSHSMTEKEEHRMIMRALSSLPAKARSAFFLGRIEGFELFEIAMIQNREEEEVKADIEKCVELLKSEIANLDLSPTASNAI